MISLETKINDWRRRCVIDDAASINIIVEVKR